MLKKKSIIKKEIEEIKIKIENSNYPNYAVSRRQKFWTAHLKQYNIDHVNDLYSIESQRQWKAITGLLGAHSADQSKVLVL